MTKDEIQGWLNELDDESGIYIDDGGLSLCAKSPNKNMEIAYLEVGGCPLGDE